MIDKAIEILQKTNDGNDLSPNHLYLIQCAVNGDLNTRGEQAFGELYENATKAGGYTAPWFCGVEHVTQDHEGYVYWKGVEVEHFTNGAFKDYETMKTDAEELATRCTHLESIGVEVNCRNVVWQWEKYA